MTRRHMQAAWATCALAAVVWACGGDGGTAPVTGLQPDIVAIDPDSGNVGTQVAITGSNFEDDAAVTFGRFAADSLIVQNLTTILAYAPDSLKRDTVYSVTVTNLGGRSDALASAYKAVGPFLQAVNGVSKPSGNTGSTVIFEGRSFGDLLGKGTVYFTDGAGQPVEAPVALAENWTNEFIVTTVPTSAETGPVWIETPTGSTDSVVFTLLEAATFSPSLIQWTETTALPDSSQGHGAAFLAIEGGSGAGNLIYVTGGADGALSARNSVAYAVIDAQGQLSAYTSVQALPAGRAFHGTGVATPFNAFIDTAVAGYLYVLGGIDGSGAPTATAYRATVNKDRSLGSWSEMTPLPVPLHAMGVTIFRSWLYVVGGSTSGNAPRQDVHRARINVDGSLGTWEAQPALPYPRAYASLAQFAGVLYVVGGDSGTVAPGVNTETTSRVSQIHYHPLDLRTGRLKNASWSLNPNELIKAVAKHSAVVAGGTVLVSGGIYQGDESSSTEHQYASINADGTVGSFNGATGDQVIAQPTCRLAQTCHAFFNHAAITYVDASGAAHVVILGGNDVSNPSRPTPDTYYY